MKYDVFISYSRKDYVDEDRNVISGNIVSQIKDFLQANGYSYWFDEDGIYSGDAFPMVIAEAIQDSEIFLFVSSENSNVSKWTAKELAVAEHLGKKTTPFRVDNSKYDKSTLMYLASLDYIEYFKNHNKAFELLLASLNHHFSQRLEAEKAEKRKKEQEQKAKEQAEAMKQAEKLRLERISEIDTEIEKLQAEIDQYNADSSTIQFRIDELNEQLAQYNAELNSIINTRNGISASIAKLEQEKKSLSTPASETKEEKTKSISKKAEKDTLKSEKDKIDIGNSKIKTFWQYLTGLKKRYWFHLLILVLLATATSFYAAYAFEDAFAILAVLCGIFSIYGIYQLLRGKKNGMVTLLLNSITFYLCWYLVSEFSGFAYMGLLIYLCVVLILFAIHKSDKDSPLSWNKMKKTTFKHPKKILTYVAVISVISSFAVPYIYAQKCGMKWYDIENADRLLTYSINGIYGNPFSAEIIGDEYIPDEESINHFNLEPNAEKALWWYELAKSNCKSNGFKEYLEKKITYCKEYIESTEKGSVDSEIYGRCGINKENGYLVRINIVSYSDGENEGVYSGSNLQSNMSYKISLVNGDLTDGEFVVEGAFVENITTEKLKISNIYGDSVKMRFIQEGNVISERIIPVTKVKTELILKNETGKNYSGSLYYGQEYTIDVRNPIEGAELQIGDYDMESLMKYNIIDYDEYLNVKEKSANNIKFHIQNKELIGKKLLVIYKREDKVIASAYLFIEDDSNKKRVLKNRL